MTDVPEVLRYSAFAAIPDGGNPAGVVLDAAGLDDAEMQRIAADVGYSETAFVVGRDDAGAVPRLRVRYWSPAAEVPFCGHATVATAVALAERAGSGSGSDTGSGSHTGSGSGSDAGSGAVLFDTDAGEVALRTSRDADGSISVSFTSVEPRVLDLEADVRDRLLDLLGLTAADIDPRFPAAESFAGNRHPILVLADRDLFHQFRFSPAAVAAMMREQGWLGTVTVLHALGSDEWEARNLFPVGRITEDPATGSAAASTGAYLREHGFSGRTITIRQGAHVGRPSVLTVTIPVSGGIEVAGGATRIG